MVKPPSYQDIHGTTRVGDFLRSIKKSELVGKAIDTAAELTAGDVLGALQILLGKDDSLTPEERQHALELVKLDIEKERGITRRWEADLYSDSRLSKNIRPLSLIFLTVCSVLLIVLDSLNINFTVKEAWVDLLQILLVTVFSAYFGSRGLEKVTKMKNK